MSKTINKGREKSNDRLTHLNPGSGTGPKESGIGYAQSCAGESCRMPVVETIETNTMGHTPHPDREKNLFESGHKPLINDTHPASMDAKLLRDEFGM